VSYVDSTRCNGCGACLDACPQQAITIQNGLAVIDQALCTQCGACAEICPAGAISGVVPAYAKPGKGGERMFYGYGRGFGFRGSSPPWPYVGRGRGGLPRCWHPGLWGAAPYPTAAPHWTAPSHEEELGVLKNQADVMKRELEDIEHRIQELERKQ
jgi:NAD-dependent dihydropyrimidine dehydrogenase PreA subunit